MPTVTVSLVLTSIVRPSGGRTARKHQENQECPYTFTLQLLALDLRLHVVNIV